MERYKFYELDFSAGEIELLKEITKSYQLKEDEDWKALILNAIKTKLAKYEKEKISKQNLRKLLEEDKRWCEKKQGTGIDPVRREFLALREARYRYIYDIEEES